MRMVVDLPAPLAPRKPKISPGSTSNVMPPTAVKAPKRFTRSRISTAWATSTYRPRARSSAARAERSWAWASV